MKTLLLTGIFVGSSLFLLTLSSCTKDRSENQQVNQTNITNLKPNESLRMLTRILADYARPTRSLQDLLKELESTGQKPKILKDSNGLLEDVYLVRTEHPPRGTRYFHAVYETRDDQPLIKHMSFEYHPGDQSMTEAVATVEEIFPPDKRRRQISSEDFIIWSLSDGYVVWVKKMTLEDITDHPLNAYTEQDTGVIKIAVEKDPLQD